MIRGLLVISLLLGIGLAAAGYLAGGYVWPGVVLLVLGGGWLAGLLHGWRWSSTIGLFCVYGFSAAGLLLNLPLAFLFAGALCAFLAWDLTDFESRLRLASPEDDLPGLVRRHLARLGLVLLIGLALSLASLAWRAKAGFEWTVILVLFSIWGIGQVIRRLLGLS
jgi:hypothetical protein